MSKLANKVEPEKWVDEYGDYLLSFALVRVNSRAVAEDLVQDTFLAALKQFEKFAGKSSVKTWLTTILRNKIIDHYRKSGRTESFSRLAEFYEKEETELFSDDGHWQVDKPHMVPAEWKAEQVRSLDHKDFRIQFESCSEKLPSKVRTVFVMREVDGDKSSEICETLGISQANFWTILHRARMALRNCIEQNWILKK